MRTHKHCFRGLLLASTDQPAKVPRTDIHGKTNGNREDGLCLREVLDERSRGGAEGWSHRQTVIWIEKI